jgi:hypothetical protein
LSTPTTPADTKPPTATPTSNLQKGYHHPSPPLLQTRGSYGQILTVLGGFRICLRDVPPGRVRGCRFGPSISPRTSPSRACSIRFSVIPLPLLSSGFGAKRNQNGLKEKQEQDAGHLHSRENGIDQTISHTMICHLVGGVNEHRLEKRKQSSRSGKHSTSFPCGVGPKTVAFRSPKKRRKGFIYCW